MKAGSGRVGLSLILIPAALLFFFCASGKESRRAKNFTYDWQIGGNAEIVCRTALGTAVKLAGGNFTLDSRFKGNYAPCAVNLESPADKALSTMNLVLFRNRRDAAQAEGAVSIDFTVRIFPGMKRQTKPDPEDLRSPFRNVLIGWTSALQPASSRDELAGIFCAVDPMFAESSGVRTGAGVFLPAAAPLPNAAPLYNFIDESIYYAPLKVRLILEPATGKYSIWNHEIRRDFQLRTNGKEIPAFGTVVIGIPDRIIRTVEFSQPEVRFYGSLGEALAQPPPRPEPYPYDRYFPSDRKNSWRNNPDFQYRQAMRLIYGPAAEWERGLKELEHTAETAGHALAYYQLGCAAWRGFGPKGQDTAKAARFLRRAFELNVYQAGELLELMMYRAYAPASFPKGLRLPFHPVSGKGAVNTGNRYADLPLECRIRNNPKLEYVRLKTFFSAQSSGPADPAARDAALKNLDFLCGTGYAPAFYLRGLFRKSAKEQYSDFAAGAALGNPECAFARLTMQALGVPGFEIAKASFEDKAAASEFPLFHLLHYLSRTGGTQELNLIFRQREYRPDQTALRTPRDHFLYGAWVLQDLLYRESGCGYDRLKSRRTIDSLFQPFDQMLFADALNSVSIAADSGIPEAQCLAGIFPAEGRLMRKDPAGAARLLLAAVQSGYEPAMLAAGRLAVSENDTALLRAAVSPLRNRKTPEILAMRARLFSQERDSSGRLSPATMEAWRAAAAAGSPEAMLFLANCEYGTGDRNLGAAYRNYYLKADAKMRETDPFDLFWTDLPVCFEPARP